MQYGLKLDRNMPNALRRTNKISEIITLEWNKQTSLESHVPFTMQVKAQGSMRTVPVLIKGIVPVSNKFTIIARLAHY